VEARDFAAAIWSSQEGRHTVVIRDDDRDGAVVEARSRLSQWQLFRNDASLTLMAIIVAIVGLFLKSKK
jgi:hypothetical protein